MTNGGDGQGDSYPGPERAWTAPSAFCGFHNGPRRLRSSPGRSRNNPWRLWSSARQLRNGSTLAATNGPCRPCSSRGRPRSGPWRARKGRWETLADRWFRLSPVSRIRRINWALVPHPTWAPIMPFLWPRFAFSRIFGRGEGAPGGRLCPGPSYPTPRGLRKCRFCSPDLRFRNSSCWARPPPGPLGLEYPIGRALDPSAQWDRV